MFEKKNRLTMATLMGFVLSGDAGCMDCDDWSSFTATPPDLYCGTVPIEERVDFQPALSLDSLFNDVMGVDSSSEDDERNTSDTYRSWLDQISVIIRQSFGNTICRSWFDKTIKQRDSAAILGTFAQHINELILAKHPHWTCSVSQVDIALCPLFSYTEEELINLHYETHGNTFYTARFYTTTQNQLGTIPLLLENIDYNNVEVLENPEDTRICFQLKRAAPALFVSNGQLRWFLAHSFFVVVSSKGSIRRVSPREWHIKFIDSRPIKRGS
ncbi:MAG: hypothetical protein LBF54_01935 [Holosporaceae bacterium]|nr:hypothetical protein [Holosporaceae bacterium]